MTESTPQQQAPQPQNLFASGLPAMYALAFLAGMCIALFNPLISTFMEERNAGSFWIGAISTIYFLTIALSATLVERGMRRLGVVRVIQCGLILAGLATPLFVFTEALPLWLMVRVLMAAGVALFLIGGQTALNSLNTDENRAATNGIYSLSMAMGFALGPIIGPQVYAHSPQLAFVGGGIVTLSGVVFVWAGLPSDIQINLPDKSARVWKKIAIPAFTVFSYGFLEATLFSIFPLFILRQGFSVEKMGIAFSILMMGSLISIVPVTMLADYVGRLKMLFWCIVTGMVAGVGMVMSDSYGDIVLFSLIGGMGFGPVFPLSLSIVAQLLSREAFPSGAALFTALFSFGCAAGPLSTAMVMDWWGNEHVFTLTIVLFLGVMGHILIGGRGDVFKAKQEIPMDPVRRRFIKYSGITVAGLTTVTYGSTKINRVDYGHPAYKYWFHKDQGGMSDTAFVIMCGTLAASPHNTQPWKFRTDGSRIRVYADKYRSLGAADPDLRLLSQGIGCALENMMVAAESMGYREARLEVTADAEFDATGLCAVIDLLPEGAEKLPPEKHTWFDPIFERQTNRGGYDPGFEIPFDFRTALAGADDLQGVGVTWFDAPEDVKRIADITIEAVRVFLNNDDMVSDANYWFRLKRQEYEYKADGISIFPTAAPFFIKHLYQWGLDRADLDTEAVKQGDLDHIKATAPATSLWGVIWADERAWNKRIAGGRILEMAYLEAARRGYAICPLSYAADIKKTENMLRRMVGKDRNAEVLCIFRVGRAAALDRSVRMDLRQVII